MNELKEIAISIFKSPTFIPLLATLIVTNQKWLFPQIPQDVVTAFLNFLAMILGAVAIYYAGKTVQKNEYKQEALRQQTLLSRQQKLEK